LKLKKLIKSRIKIVSGLAIKENIALFKFWQTQENSRVY
jgi:hypothetical protein